MKIKYHKQFEKRFKKLPKSLQRKTIASIERFTQDPHNTQLRNHALKGKLKGLRAISVTGDIRIIFREHEGYTVVITLDVGSHAQVYGM